MTYNEFLNQLAAQRQGAPGKPQITYVRSNKPTRPGAERQTQPTQQGATQKQEINPTNPYAETMDQWLGSWDWKQGYMPATMPGPNGEEAPFGSQGWDRYGNPNYGDGMLGFWNKLKSKLTAPFVEETGESPLVYKPQGEVTGALGVPGGLSPEQKAKIGQKTEEVSQVGIGETVKNVQAGAAGETAGKVTRLVGATVDLALAVLNEPAIKTEQVISMGLEAQKIAEETNLPGSEDLPDWLHGIIESNPMTSAANMAWNDIRYALSPGDMKDKWEQLEPAYQSGRVLYSSVLDPQITPEFQRRYLAGENPYLLAQELENPLAEMAGQLVLDPLNLLGAGTRAARDTKRINDAVDMYAKVAPEIMDLIKTSDAIDDIRAAEKFTDVVKVIVSHANDVKAGITKLATERGLFALTAEGARWETTRIANTVLKDIAQATKDDPDEAMDIVRALMNFASGDEDKAADGLSAILGASNRIKDIKPETLLSEAGLRTGAILNNMVGDEKKASEFIQAFGEARKLDTDKFIEWAAGRLDGAIKEMFPTVTDRMKLAKSIASGKITAPTDYQRAVAKVSPAMQKLASFDNFLQSGKFGVRTINGFFANVYLGASPAYAMRNGMQNYLQMFLDEGPAVFRGASHAAEDIQGWLGGIIPEGAKGFSSAAAATSKRFGATKLAEHTEKRSATLVIRHTVEQTMRRMLQPGRALPDTAPLIEAGLSKPAADHLWRLVVDNKGDVGKAVKAFFNKSATGSLDVMETLGWLNSKDAKGLQDLKIYDGVLQTIRDGRQAGKTVDEVITDVKKLFDDNIYKVADGVADDPVALSRELPEFEEIVRASDEMGDVESKIVGNIYQANREAFYNGRLALDNILRGGIAQAESTGDAELLVSLQTLDGKYGALASGKREGQITGEINKWSDNWNDWKLGIEAAIKNGVPVDLGAKWKELGMTSEAPKEIGEFYNRFWNEFYYPQKNAKYAAFRTELVDALTEVGKSVGGNTAEINAALNYAKQADAYQETFELWRKGRLNTAAMLQRGDIPNAIRAMASQYGISTAPKAEQAAGTTGVILKDETLLNIINKNSGKQYKTLAEVDPSVAQKAFAKHAGKKAGVTETIGQVAGQKVGQKAGQTVEVGEEVTTAAKNIPVYTGDMAPSVARTLHESRTGITELLGRIEQQVRDNYGGVVPTIGNEKTTAAVTKWAEAATKGVNEARLISSAVADAARDFTLLPYGKKYGFDLALNYIMPYQFWYSRTYANYLKRIVQEPEILAAYAKYKNTLGKIHAGAPDWWKYNINSNELLGMDSDNPLYFNLEATLNPLNGLTGVDFNDANKRINWWTSMIDDLGKFGPSLWTPINWAVAAVLQSQGETDAAQRWGGRIFPQSSTIKSLLYMGNIKTGIPYNELDPMVQFMSGGLDPYERRRVGRALGWMVEEGQITQTQMVEAANAQSGDVWDQAVARAVKSRAPGQVTSFFLGVGFKGRSVSDLTIDKFYNEYNRLWDMSDTLSPDEVRRQLDEIRTKYPFMDGVLLSRKSGLDRDRGYAYNVLARIAPGQKSDIAKAAGISSELMDKFYADKGDMTKWGKSDYQKFMSAMVDIGALLEVPESGTRQEWTTASIAYKDMRSQAQSLFGTDIWDRLDVYYSYGDDYLSQQKAKALLDADLELQEVMDWQNQTVLENPDLYAYYGGIQTVEKYYRGLMYTDMEQRFGKDIFEIQDGYYAIFDDKERKKYLKEHPQLKKLWDAKTVWEKNISGYILNTADMMPEGISVQLQPGAEPVTTGQEAVAKAATPEQKYTWDEYQQIMGSSLSNLVMDNILGGEELSYAAENQLEYIADEMNISVERLLALMAQSLPR